MNAMSSRTLGISAALTATILWGMQFPVLGAVLHDLDPFWLTFVRYLTATLILAAVVLLREGRGAFSLEGRGWTVAGLGILGFSVFNVALLLGIRISGPQHGSLIMATTPLLVVLVGWLRGGAKPTVRTLGVIALAFFGVALVVTKGNPASVLAAGDWIGDLLMLGGALCWATYTSWIPAFSSWSPLRYTMLGTFFGTLSTAVIALVATMFGFSHLPRVGGFVHALPGMAFLAIAGAVISLVAWNIGIAKLGAPTAVLFMNVVPITAFAIAIGFGARYPAIEYVGAAITIFALVLNNIVARPRMRPVLAAVEGDRSAFDHQCGVA